MGGQPEERLGDGLYRHPKTGIIWLRFRHKRREYRRSTGERNPRSAAIRGRQIRTEIEQGELARVARRTTLEELSVIDLADTQDAGHTDHYYETQVSRWRVVLRELGPETDISGVTYEAVRTYEGRRRKAGIRGQTIYRETSCLKRAWQIAKRRGYVDAVPDEWPKIRRDPSDRHLSGKLWPPEVIAAYLEKLHRDARDEVEVAALTGLRIGELKKVEADWLRPLPRGSAVPAMLQIPESASKTREARQVPVPARAWVILKRRIRALRRIGDPVFSPRDFKKHRRRICLDAETGLGLPAVITLRDMRHTYATHALQGTSDPVAVMRSLGHRDLRTTEMYLSSSTDRLALVGAAAEAALAGSPRGITKKTRSRKVAK